MGMQPLIFLRNQKKIDFTQGFELEVFLLLESLDTKTSFGIGPLQLAIHAVQNRHAGTQKSHWGKTKKRHT